MPLQALYSNTNTNYTSEKITTNFNNYYPTTSKNNF